MEVAEPVALGVKMERGNVLRIDRGAVEAAWLELVSVSVLACTDGGISVSVDSSEDVTGGTLVSSVTLVGFPEGVALDVNATEEFFEKEFLSVKLGIVELFGASALVSVAPGPVEELLDADARLVGVGTGADGGIEVGVKVETEVDVETMNVVEVLEVLQHSESTIKEIEE